MRHVLSKVAYAMAIVVAGSTLTSPVLADKPSWAGKGKGEQREHRGGERNDHDGKRKHFEDNHRAMVRDYYAEEYRRGHCPPGLAKKNNGCMPPGQAKKWKVGRPLPRDVRYYEVPQPLIVKIGTPPAGHKYVRVATDILMIAIGTGMVIDAIQDLGR